MTTCDTESLHPAEEPVRTGMSVAALKRAIADNLFYVLGRFPDVATDHDYYMAVAYTVRDRLLDRWIKSAQTYKLTRARTLCYLSAEFLPGPHLGNNLTNLGILDNTRQALAELDLSLDEILEQEDEPGLGSGGLGRLAACYLDSLATLQIPAIGYGIRYEFGIFHQKIEDGWQVELTDSWLRNGNPWELPRPKLRFPVKFGGYTEHYRDDGRLVVKWVPDLVMQGVAYDTPILGFGVANANLLRLWKSEACEAFDLQSFNTGNYYGAVNAKVVAENVTKILYPNDEPEVGKELRLKQQYFFVSCSLQDMIRLHLRFSDSLDGFDEKFVAQLNDTHPAIAVVELMRLLLDEHALPWDQAWDITRRTFAYTNHTLLPEALETWSVDLFQRILPRHLEILYEINRRFLDLVRVHFLDDNGRVARLSLIDEGNGRRVRMAHLACAGSFAINGVSRMHTNLLKTTVLRDFHDLWPERFHNVTNGVTPRRFMQVSHPELCSLLTGVVGSGWSRDLERLERLESLSEDPHFQDRWRRAKRAAKDRLATLIRDRTGVSVTPESLFDVQMKRIHEYKRQHLNALHIISLYQRIKQDPSQAPVPRTFVFGGKAAPGYRFAKLLIKLINALGEVINGDPDVNHHLRVVFVPDFNVGTGQRVYPGADLSEQISTAGKEASGTGNMKFALNGALTIGTLDGANAEIREAVGQENFFLFGLTAEQVGATQLNGYRPWEIYEGNPRLKAALDLLGTGLFSHGDKTLFRPLIDNLIRQDPYLVMADFQAYTERQADVDLAYRDQGRWTRMSILNVARMGRFSSDRAIREYCERIWKIQPVPVAMDCCST